MCWERPAGERAECDTSHGVICSPLVPGTTLTHSLTHWQCWLFSSSQHCWWLAVLAIHPTMIPTMKKRARIWENSYWWDQNTPPRLITGIKGSSGDRRERWKPTGKEWEAGRTKLSNCEVSQEVRHVDHSHEQGGKQTPEKFLWRCWSLEYLLISFYSTVWVNIKSIISYR